MTDKELFWLNSLKDISSILDKYNCKYFLDTGTLLGAVRDKCFIPWDNDIDLAVVEFENQTDIILSICHDIYRAGYNVTATVDEIDVSKESGGLDLGIKFYHKDNNYYWAILGKIEGSRLSHSIYMSLSRSILIKRGYSSYVVKSIVSKLLRLASYITPSFVKDYFLKKASVKANTIKIPQKLLKSFVPYSFYNETFCVPNDYDNYLEFRYGRTWRKPNPLYDFTKDDNAIVK